MRALRKLLVSTTVIALLVLAAAIYLRMTTPTPPPTPSVQEPERVAAARSRCGAALCATFEKAGLRYPADEVMLRVMKRERQLELWARGDVREFFRLVKTFSVTAASGGPGPKRREGDMQVPEGFYKVDRFNPRSNFHLSLGLNYPNADDLLHADPAAPGSDIFIHGGDASIGCVALGDGAVEEVYLAANDSRARPVRVQLFPARMDAPDWPAWRDAQLRQHPEFRELWARLAEGWARFGR